MANITISDLDPTNLEFSDNYLSTLTDSESVLIMGGRPPVHERWWFKALVKIGTGIITAVAVDKIK
ncbi:MAG: hypothetical protein AAF378_18030 [Cyanobacteria bacterium P01_A01_bin.84]